MLDLPVKHGRKAGRTGQAWRAASLKREKLFKRRGVQKETERGGKRNQGCSAAVTAVCVAASCCHGHTNAAPESSLSACGSQPNAQRIKEKDLCVQCLKAKEVLTGCRTGVNNRQVWLGHACSISCSKPSERDFTRRVAPPSS